MHSLNPDHFSLEMVKLAISGTGEGKVAKHDADYTAMSVLSQDNKVTRPYILRSFVA